MELYKLSDIKEELKVFSHNSDENIVKISSILINFFSNVEEELTIKILSLLFDEIGAVPTSNDLRQFNNLLQEPIKNRDFIFEISNAIVNISDVEDFCDNKIYIVVTNFYGETADYVREYDSWEEAEKDIDEWYTSCCDDLYMAENMMFPILCAVQGREYDYTVNFCTVIEFNAIGLEEGRESWEDENCDFDDCD